MVRLGVNIDHVATIREARRADEPDPVAAALECVKAGCSSIVCHLREDRRHIADEDVSKLRRVIANLNLEMSVAKEIVDIACRIKPDQATLVPEKRREITTEGGLDVKGGEGRIKSAVSRLKRHGIAVSLFIDPVKAQIDASKRVGAGIVEFHTGEYANANNAEARKRELGILKSAASYASKKGLTVNAGHGLNYKNAKAIARIKGMYELNIGHSIVSRAVFCGIGKAVKEMIAVVK